MVFNGLCSGGPEASNIRGLAAHSAGRRKRYCGLPVAIRRLRLCQRRAEKVQRLQNWLSDEALKPFVSDKLVGHGNLGNLLLSHAAIAPTDGEAKMIAQLCLVRSRTRL
jgi:hypothetical protein